MAEKERVIPAIAESRMKLVEHAIHQWIFYIPPGHKVEDLMQPQFWAHVSRKFSRCDEITAICDDFSWEASFRVVDAGIGYAIIRQRGEAIALGGADITKQAGKLLPGHSVEYKGIHGKWTVIREVDKQILKEGMTTESEAVGWLAQYSRQVSRDKAA